MNGTCFCGFVTYEVEPPFSEETICHCTLCRGTSGAPFVAWATVPKAAFRLLTGDVSTFRSSSHGTRAFCPRCGTHLTFSSDRTPDQVDFTLCSLVEAESVGPKHHTWTSATLSWVHTLHTLPCHSQEAE